MIWYKRMFCFAKRDFHPQRHLTSAFTLLHGRVFPTLQPSRGSKGSVRCTHAPAGRVGVRADTKIRFNGVTVLENALPDSLTAFILALDGTSDPH